MESTSGTNMAEQKSGGIILPEWVNEITVPKYTIWCEIVGEAYLRIKEFCEQKFGYAGEIPVSEERLQCYGIYNSWNKHKVPADFGEIFLERKWNKPLDCHIQSAEAGLMNYSYCWLSSYSMPSGHGRYVFEAKIPFDFKKNSLISKYCFNDAVQAAAHQYNKMNNTRNSYLPIPNASVSSDSEGLASFYKSIEIDHFTEKEEIIGGFVQCWDAVLDFVAQINNCPQKLEALAQNLYQRQQIEESLFIRKTLEKQD